MSFMVGDQEFLNQKESIEFTGVAFATFKSLVKRLDIQEHRFRTKPKEIYFLKSDLEEIVNDTPQPVQKNK